MKAGIRQRRIKTIIVLESRLYRANKIPPNFQLLLLNQIRQPFAPKHFEQQEAKEKIHRASVHTPSLRISFYCPLFQSRNDLRSGFPFLDRVAHFSRQTNNLFTEESLIVCDTIAQKHLSGMMIINAVDHRCTIFNC